MRDIKQKFGQCAKLTLSQIHSQTFSDFSDPCPTSFGIRLPLPFALLTESTLKVFIKFQLMNVIFSSFEVVASFAGLERMKLEKSNSDIVFFGAGGST